ncbi:MAG: restriction endonuclease domain [Acidobacteriota bacterium]|jgi:hypothetical protein|nr:restriction endonuclease domain [Acidobacteriota bacterium]
MSDAPLDTAIVELEQKVRSLRTELAQAEAALKSMKRARDLLTGRAQARVSPEPRARSMIDTAELILREAGELHINQLVDRLKQSGYENADKQSLSSALSRLHAMRRRFFRTKPNTYRIRTEEDQA